MDMIEEILLTSQTDNNYITIINPYSGGPLLPRNALSITVFSESTPHQGPSIAFNNASIDIFYLTLIRDGLFLTPTSTRSLVREKGGDNPRHH